MSTFFLEYNSRIIFDSLKNYIDRKDSFYIIDDYFCNLSLGAGSNATRFFFLQATEKNKTLQTAEKILHQLQAENIKRSDTIVAIGGGITLDIAAFCASVYKRGCKLFLIPTTLIGMIDACIGGKTGLNLNHIKNQIGSFYPASEVIIDFTLLKTLPEKEIKNGFAELIKIMIIKDRTFFEQDFEDITTNLQDYIIKAINYKLVICQNDLHDHGMRQVLNLGHTIAHLLETVSNNEISHGDAVAKGLEFILQYSYLQKLISKEKKDRILAYLYHFCNKVTITPDILDKIKSQGQNILLADKKASDRVKIILINDIGVELFEVQDIGEFVDEVTWDYI